MFSFLKRNKETSKKQNSSPDLPDSSDPGNIPYADKQIKTVGLTGINVTKLDGTAKGGIILERETIYQ